MARIAPGQSLTGQCSIGVDELRRRKLPLKHLDLLKRQGQRGEQKARRQNAIDPGPLRSLPADRSRQSHCAQPEEKRKQHDNSRHLFDERQAGEHANRYPPSSSVRLV